MPEISDLRKLLKDRQLKDGALGTESAVICLDPDAAKKVDSLRDELAATIAANGAQDKARLSVKKINTSDLEARLAEAEQELAEVTIKLVFRSLSSVDYQALVNQHPGVNKNDDAEAQTDFMDALVHACLHQVWHHDTKVDDVTLDDIQEQINFGAWEQLRALCIVLNQRRYDVPFSSKPSKTTR